MIDSISPDISCFILSILISLSATKYPWTERKNYKYKSPLHAELHRKTIHLSELIKPHITTTPLIYGDNDPPTYFKMESRQITGSFKMRGALSKVLTLTAEEKRGTITTASTGNHGRACARAFNIGRVHGTVYLPCNVNKFKLDKLKAIMGEGNVKVVGRDAAEAEAEARGDADKAGGCYISPYNDVTVSAGQGTAGLELLEQLHGVIPNHLYVPVGGGGLIIGIACAVKAEYPSCRIVGCSPENSPCLEMSVRAGRILSDGEFKNSPTFSSGTAGGIDADSFTFSAASYLVDDWIQVSEDEIAGGVKFMFEEHKEVVEGAAGCGVTGWRKDWKRKHGEVCVVVCCGGNVDGKEFAEMITRS